MLDRKLFFPDDLDRINNKYFNRIREEEVDFLDPSYWFENYSKAAIEAGFENIKNYKSDYHGGLKSEKPLVLEALSSWDLSEYLYDDITMCGSATGASLTVLAYLKNVLGINRVCFETPCYFASLKQAQFFGYRVTMLPTYFPDFKLDTSQLMTDEPKVIWLTQPRFGLGTNYDLTLFDQILQALGKKDVLVVDEAAESCFPSHLAKYNFSLDPRIIKIRSPFKGIGINGPRISMIIHGDVHRHQMQNTLEQVQGSMDVFSLNFAKTIFEKKGVYRSLIAAAQGQVLNSHKKLKTAVIGTKLKLSLMESGYIGSVSINYDNDELGYTKKREALLKYCALNKMPVILGSTMNFAKDNDREHIRISYFNKTEKLVDAIGILAGFTI